MLMLSAVVNVKSTGINWESVAAIVALMSVVVTIMLYVITRRDRQTSVENQEIKQEISSAVDRLQEVLLAKLETKETVSRISERLARVEGAMKLDGG